jgi:L-fuculose-phosphate aldolase
LSKQISAEPAAPLPDTPGLREEIVHACRFLVQIGFLIGTWGNVGVRVERGLMVTPSRVDFGRMGPDDLVVVGWDGVKIGGERVPSSETELHRLILLNRPDLGACVHTHSPYASAVSCARRSIPVISEDVSQIIGGEVKCSRYVPAGRHRDLAGAAWEAMGLESSAVLLANHGAVAGGRDLAEAVVAAQVLEKAAMSLILASAVGGAVVIDEALVKEERHRFLYKYGKE